MDVFIARRFSSVCLAYVNSMCMFSLCSIFCQMFNARNWRPIVLSAVLTSSKVWDDLSSWNIEFAEVFPIFTLKDINALERLFLEGLKYNLFVSGIQHKPSICA